MAISLTQSAIVRIGGPLAARTPGSTGQPSEPRSLGDIARDLLAASRLHRLDMALLVGGEPTARRDLPQLLQLVTKVGLTPALATDGRLLTSPKLRELLLQRQVGYIRVPLHGARAATHDRLVGAPGAHAETSAGVAAMLAQGSSTLVVDVAFTVAATNTAELSDHVEQLARLPRQATLGLRFVAPAGGLDDDEWPDFVAAARQVTAAVQQATELGADIIVTWEGFPPCLLDETVAQLRDETLRYGAVAFGPPEAGTALPRESAGSRSHPLPCQDCTHLSTCPGAPEVFIARAGEQALAPTRRLCANSFNFELRRELPSFQLRATSEADASAGRRGSCSALDLEHPDGPLRSVILVDEERRFSHYHTPTQDFTAPQISQVKDQLEQLYLDNNVDSAALTDFMENIRRLRFHSECRSCADRGGCCQTVAPEAEPPFRREERWLGKEVSRLRGRVLDVGCGELLYREVLDELIAGGSIEYYGVDPDEESLTHLRESGFAGNLHVGQIEEFDFQPGYFDYVLMLRSLNHFRDVDQAFRVAARVLRAQGQLVICDSPPFGMLRTAEQVGYADEHARIGHEHYRNWTSDQVVELLKRFPFRLDIHRPVSPKTSNEWILKYMRSPDAT